MKLIKKEQDHFVLMSEGQIIASTDSGDDVTQLSLREIKKLVGESSLKEDFLAVLERSGKDANPFEKQGIQKGFILGWGLCEDENKDKKYTVEDVKKIIKWLQNNAFSVEDELAKPFEDEDETLPETFFHDAYNEALNRAFQSIEPRTEWDVEFVNSKITLI
jgi:hypothetical protein